MNARGELRRRTPLRRGGKRMRPASPKRARQLAERREVLRDLFWQPARCEVPWCTEQATDPHEPRTRARCGSITDWRNIRGVCRAHHREIHDTEPAWAYEHGFLIHSWEDDTDES